MAFCNMYKTIRDVERLSNYYWSDIRILFLLDKFQIPFAWLTKPLPVMAYALFAEVAHCLTCCPSYNWGILSTLYEQSYMQYENC